MKVLPGIVLAIGTSLVMLNSEKCVECASVPFGHEEVCLYVPFGSNEEDEIGLFSSKQYFDHKKCNFT